MVNLAQSFAGPLSPIAGSFLLKTGLSFLMKTRFNIFNKQVVKQKIYNSEVVGSIPSRKTIWRKSWYY